MTELWLLLKAYLNLGVQWLVSHSIIKRRVIYHSTTKYLKKGDYIESRSGKKGKVWRVYVEIKTGKPKACSVIWETSYNGEKITPLLPVEDKSPQFNPVIRKI